MTRYSILRGWSNYSFGFFGLGLLNFTFFSFILLVAQIILTRLLHWNLRLALNTCCVCFIKWATFVASYMNVHGMFQLVRLLLRLLLDLLTRLINLWGHRSKEHDIEEGKLLLLRPSRRSSCQNQKSLLSLLLLLAMITLLEVKAYLSVLKSILTDSK